MESSSNLPAGRITSHKLFREANRKQTLGNVIVIQKIIETDLLNDHKEKT